MLFCVAGQHFFPDNTAILYDMFVYSASFMLGYYICSKYYVFPNTAVYASEIKYVYRSEYILFCVLVGKLFVLLFMIGYYGVAQYYSGSDLLYQFESYGQANYTLGFLTIVRNVVDISAVSSSVLYVYTCILCSRKYKYTYLLLLLVIIPALSLRRSDFVLGIMFVLMVYNYSVKKNSYVVMSVITICAIVVIALVGICYGAIRNSLVRNRPFEDIGETEIQLNYVYGELNPIIAYNNICLSINELGYQYGRTIGPAILFKVIPRSWMPNKPVSSSEYVMRQLYPAEANAGYYMSTSIFGDMYLNYGYFGVIVFCALLGLYVARLDMFYTTNSFMGLPEYMIVYWHFYILMRGDLQGAVGYGMLTVIVYLVFKRYVGLTKY
jgi:oligosaccharide repeat unit polymerase